MKKENCWHLREREKLQGKCIERKEIKKGRNESKGTQWRKSVRFGVNRWWYDIAYRYTLYPNLTSAQKR